MKATSEDEIHRGPLTAPMFGSFLTNPGGSVRRRRNRKRKGKAARERSGPDNVVKVAVAMFKRSPLFSSHEINDYQLCSFHSFFRRINVNVSCSVGYRACRVFPCSFGATSCAALLCVLLPGCSVKESVSMNLARSSDGE